VVRLTRIYTRTGDGGETHLGDMSRVPKDHPRVVAFGEVDELNSAIGLARGFAPPAEIGEMLAVVQNDLFDLGADLCAPVDGSERLRVTPELVERLERWCDQVNDGLESLTSFVLPAGEPAAGALHLARAICRRAERAVVRLRATEEVGEPVLIYLNRLSDLLFVLARDVNRRGGGDVLWVPGAGRDPAE
jgi:cob(I)alamin adenosyltransferase